MCKKDKNFESLKLSKQMTLKLHLKHFIFRLMLTHLVIWNQLKVFAKKELQNVKFTTHYSGIFNKGLIVLANSYVFY